MSVYPGFTKFLHIAAESSWGTKNETPSYLHLPVLAETIKATPQVVVSEHFAGVRQKLHAEAVATDVAGNITTSLFGWQDGSNKSLAQHLVEWATNQPTGWQLDSKTVERFDNDVDNKRYLGCRVNQMTLSGGAGQPIQISLDIIGKSEAGGITEQTWTKATAVAILKTQFWFHSATFELPLTTSIAIESFSLTVNNQLQPKYLNGSTLAHLTAGERLVTFQLQFPKTANTYDALRRAIGVNETTAKISLQGLHGGTGAGGNNTTLVITLNRLAFQDAAVVDQDKNALVSVGPSYMALSDTDSDNEITLTWDDDGT